MKKQLTNKTTKTAINKLPARLWFQVHLDKSEGRVMIKSATLDSEIAIRAFSPAKVRGTKSLVVPGFIIASCDGHSRSINAQSRPSYRVWEMATSIANYLWTHFEFDGRRKGESYFETSGDTERKVKTRLENYIVSQCLKLVKDNDRLKLAYRLSKYKSFNDKEIEIVLSNQYLMKDIVRYSACAHAVEKMQRDLVEYKGENWRDFLPSGKNVNKFVDAVGMRHHNMINYLVQCEQHLIKDLRPEYKGFTHTEALMDSMMRLHYADKYNMHNRTGEIVMAGISQLFKWLNNSSNTQLLHAIQKFKRFTHGTWKRPFITQIRAFNHFIEDATQFEGITLPPDNATVVRAIEWAIEAHVNKVKMDAEKHRHELLATPPWGNIAPLGWKLLTTGSDLIEEGNTMSHCVGGYIGKAMEGNCFIYHMELEGIQATIEIVPNRWDGNRWQIAQSYGPHDKENLATQRSYDQWNKFRKDNKLEEMGMGNIVIYKPVDVKAIEDNDIQF